MEDEAQWVLTRTEPEHLQVQTNNELRQDADMCVCAHGSEKNERQKMSRGSEKLLICTRNADLQRPNYPAVTFNKAKWAH